MLYVKLSLFQLVPRHSFNNPWSAPSQEPLSLSKSMSSLNLSSPGEKTMTPELKMSGHPTSGAAENSWSKVNK